MYLSFKTEEYVILYISIVKVCIIINNIKINILI